jgi:acetyltransferase-like isoleucine patch superfamily enzyme
MSLILNIYRRKIWSAQRYAKWLGVKIGKNCSISSKSFGSEPYLIELGDRVQVTRGVSFFNHGGGWVFREKHPEFDYFGKIKIGNNVYIGNYALIMPGVTIGNNVIIGAGTIVTKSIADNSICVGNPGRVINNINNLEEKIKPFMIQSKKLSRKDKRDLLLSLSDEMFIKK